MVLQIATAIVALLLVSSVSAQEGSGEPASVEETASPFDLSAVEVTLEAPGPYQTSIGLPFDVAVSIRVPDVFELVSISVSGDQHIELTESSPLGEEAGLVSQTLQLVVFRSGEFSSSGIEALVIDQNGQQHRVSSAPFVVSVESRIVNESDPAPAPSDPPMVVFSRDMRPIYAGSALGFVGLGALIAALWRRRNRVEDAAEADEVVKRPAWEVAFEALDALAAEDMLETGRHLEFHMRLSEILREYIGARFAFLALEMTTTEIASALSERETGEYRQELLEVLGDMDLVKFAKFTPSRDLSDGCFDSTKRVVTELSARERQEQIVATSVTVAVSNSSAQASLPDPHAPSPDSTTVSFAGNGEDVPENVVDFPTQLAVESSQKQSAGDETMGDDE